MYRVIAFVLFAVAVTLAASNEEQTKCSRVLMHPAVKYCCKKGIHHHFKSSMAIHRRTHNDELNLKECFHHKKSDPCEKELCIANKKGFASADGEIDRDALAMVIENEFNENSELKEAIEENCVGEDLSKFGPEDLCDVLKLRLCIEIQHLKACVEWDDEVPCEGTKKLVEDCMQLSA